ncbi:MAG: hypothetical protein V2A54_04550 [Bacteroidota bacterium]
MNSSLKTFLVVELLLIMLTFGSSATHFINDKKNAPPDTTGKQLVYEGKLLRVYVEKAIYHSPNSPNFILKFLIQNKSDKKLGVDLTNYWKVIYPNQWGFYTKPYRETVDETTIIPDKTFDKAGLIRRYKKDSLSMIPPKETYIYYRDWNGSGEMVEMKNSNEFFIITVDGQLFCTNGKETEQVQMDTVGESKRAVVMPYPLQHKNMPPVSVFIGKK